jgi:hypothetical protein
MLYLGYSLYPKTPIISLKYLHVILGKILIHPSWALLEEKMSLAREVHDIGLAS